MRRWLKITPSLAPLEERYGRLPQSIEGLDQELEALPDRFAQRGDLASAQRPLPGPCAQAQALIRETSAGVASLSKQVAAEQDVPDQHTYLWYSGQAPEALQAEADGRPWSNSEFWYSYWQPQDKIAAWYGEDLAGRYARFQGGRSPEGEEATRQTADAQFWTDYLHDCNGFLWFYWLQGSDSLEQPNGLLRESAAEQYNTMRQAEALTPLLRRTVPDARLAVLVPYATLLVQDATHGNMCAAPFLALTALHVPHVGLTEKQIVRGDLRKYTHLYLAQGYALPGAVADAVRDWVRAGGTLILAGAAGVTDELGNRRDYLADLSGVTFGPARAGRLG